MNFAAGKWIQTGIEMIDIKGIVIGNGLIGTAFSDLAKSRSDLVIFASGVSDSNETSESEFSREEDLLQQTMSKHPEKKIVYFSTCSIIKIPPSHSPYVEHKLHMEEIVKTCSSYLIIRLPNVVGNGGNSNNLVNFLIDKIRKGENIDVWKNSYRNIIDLDDAVTIVTRLIKKEVSNCTVRVTSVRNYTVPELIEHISEYVGKEPNITEITLGFKINICPSDIVMEIIQELGLKLDDNYFEKILRKYY